MINYYDYEEYKKGCCKNVWLNKNKTDIIDEKRYTKQDELNEVKEKARQYIGDGYVINYDEDKEKLAEKTKKHMDKNKIIYDASFIYKDKDIYTKCDAIEINEDSSINIYLIVSSNNIYKDKNKTKIKDKYIDKLLFSYYVLEKLEYIIKDLYIIHFKEDYERDEELEIDKLFEKENIKEYIANVDEYIKKYITNVDEYIEKIIKCINEDSEPDKNMIKYCIQQNDKGCKYRSYCWNKIPNNNILYGISGNFKRLTYEKRIAAYKKGIINFEDAIIECDKIEEIYNKSEEYINKDTTSDIEKRVYAQLHCELSDNEVFINKEGLKKFLANANYPLYFLDFENVCLAIPPCKGMKPNQKTPFQFSIHCIEYEGAELKHLECIEIVDVKSEEKLADELVNFIQNKGTIIVKHKDSEIEMLQCLEKKHDCIQVLKGEDGNAIKDKVIINNNEIKILDLEEVFIKGYYYKKGLGSDNSLKSIVRVLFPDDEIINYKNNNTQQGGEVKNQYINMLSPNKIQAELIKEDLLEYCYLDTLSLVKILELLIKEIYPEKVLCKDSNIRRTKRESKYNFIEPLWIEKEKEYTDEEYNAIKYIINKTNIDESIAAIIAERNNFNCDDIDYYLEPKLKDDINLKDIDKAISIIHESIKNNEKIRIVGDYDVDGITSTYILLLTFEALGYDNIDYYIPIRKTDGYGISEKIVKNIHSENKQSDNKVKLIITVDNGISAIEPIKRAKELDMKVIVTDHHEPQTNKPIADAIIDPKQLDCPYNCKVLAGGGVAYKLSQALINSSEQKVKDIFYNNGYYEKIVSLAAIATVCDVADLVDENRAIVRKGLDYMNDKSLESVSRIAEKITVEALGFKIGPRLNACGRMKNADIALEYLKTENIDDIDNKKEELDKLNSDRKDEQNKSKYRILDKIYEYETLPDIIVEIDDEAHESVVGLCAGKVKEEFYRPTIVFTKSEKGEYKGSGRSIDEYNLFENIKPYLESIEGLSGGGHPMACGLKAKNIEQIYKLRDALNQNSKLTEYDKQKKIIIDKSIEFEEDLIKKLCEDMAIMEPCGTGNPRANIKIKDVTIAFDKFSKNKIKVHKDNNYHINGNCWEENIFIKKYTKETIKGDIIANLYLNELGEVEVNLIAFKDTNSNY